MRRHRSQYREITVGLTPAQYEYLREEARTRTTSIAQLVRELLQEELPQFPQDVSREYRPAKVDDTEIVGET